MNSRQALCHQVTPAAGNMSYAKLSSQMQLASFLQRGSKALQAMQALCWL